MKQTINPDHTSLRAKAEDRINNKDRTAAAEMYAAYYPDQPRQVYFSLRQVYFSLHFGPAAGSGELTGHLGPNDLGRFAELLTAAKVLIEENAKPVLDRIICVNSAATAPAASEPENTEE